MEETSHSQQPEIIHSHLTPEPKPKFQLDKAFYLPLAIIIAGILIAGAVLYTNSSKNDSVAGNSEQVTLTIENLKKWAGSLSYTDKGLKNQVLSCIGTDKYLDRIQELLETPIAIVSVGHKRDHTIVIEDPIHGPKRVLQRG